MINVGPKVLIVNSADQAQLLFLAVLASGAKRLVEEGDNFSAAYGDLATSPDTQTGEGSDFDPASPTNTPSGAVIAQADMLRITGFGDFVGADIVEAIGSKGILPVAQVSTITFTANTPVAGTEITLEVVITGDSFVGELASDRSDYRKTLRKTLVIKAGDTASEIATRLINQFKQDAYTQGDVYLKASAGGVGELILTSTEPRNTFTVSLTGNAAEDGTVTIDVTETVKGFSGRNSYNQLSGVRMETVLVPYGESHKINQIPLKGAKYNRYEIKKRVSRPDLAGLDGTINTVPSGVFSFVIYVNEALTSYISDLTAWLNANVARRIMYTATTASAALAAENPTPTTDVDSSAPFTTGLS